MKLKKEKLKKEVKVEESLFRLTKRPEQITEDDIIFHRERKICLVCKKDVSRVNYLCPKCNGLYCIKCTEQLSVSKNKCWVCNEPFNILEPS
jgi:predicted amidophosphoribosyltransferase